VRRFARATSLDELLTKAVNRQSILDEYKPYLHQRWNEGCHDVPRLHREIRERGFPGDIQTVRRYLRPSKQRGLPVAPRPAPRPRRVVRWIMTDPDRLASGDAQELKEIRGACPHLDAAARHVRDFAAMLHARRGDLLPDWMDSVLADDLPALQSLVTGLRRDQDAVVAGLSSSWSSGQVEGQVTRIKLLKRKGYGRANPRPAPQTDSSRDLTPCASPGTSHDDWGSGAYEPSRPSQPRVKSDEVRIREAPARIDTMEQSMSSMVCRDPGPISVGDLVVDPGE
jgi:hypothetical protein